LDKENREPIDQVKVFSARGLPLKPRDIVIIAGPSASQAAKKRIGELNYVPETDE
jgi:hypothetical protein